MSDQEREFTGCEHALEINNSNNRKKERKMKKLSNCL
jgi:hypothetical protein